MSYWRDPAMTEGTMKSTRRRWLSNCLAMLAWPEVLSAQRYARTAAKSPTPHFELLDADTAGEIEAVAAQIIPSSGGPGAREAGVIYLIDRALATFAADDREAYRAGMALLLQKLRKFAALQSLPPITGLLFTDTTSADYWREIPYP